MEEDRRPLRPPDHPHRHRRQLLVDGRHRPLRPVLGDLLRSRRPHRRRPARQSRRGRRPVRGDLEPGVHAVRAAGLGRAHRPAQAVDRHRHGPGAHRRGPAGRPRQLRHRPLPGDHRRLPRPGRRRRGRVQRRLAPGDRRPPARRQFPDRRWSDALQRRPRLCAAPDHAARHAPRPPAGRRRPADAPPGADPDRRNGRGLSGTAARRSRHRRHPAPGGGAVSPHARSRHGPARRGHRPPGRGRGAVGRDRLQALRHLRLPAGPDPGRGARQGPDGGPGRFRRGDDPPARTGP